MTRDELMAAVIAAPDDDVPRLVLADWFAEQGDARGELIHVGCALADGTVEPTQREACERRYAELIAGPGTAWLTDLGLKNEVVFYNRGMVEGVALPWDRFFPVADRLFATTPLRVLQTTAFGEQGLRQWGQVPWLARLRALHFRSVGSPQLEVLLAPEDLRNLRSLVIEAQANTAFGLAGANVLAAWGRFSSLTQLGLIQTALDDEAVGLLACGALATLDLTMNDLSIKGLRVLCAQGRALRSLFLGSNRLGSAGACLIAATLLPELESVRLESAQVGDEGAHALIASTMLPRLRSLDLASNDLTDAGAVAIAALPDRGLVSLNVTGNAIGERGERALRGRYGSRVRI